MNKEKDLFPGEAIHGLFESEVKQYQVANPEKPDFVKKFERPDGTIVTLSFYKNLIGSYYISSSDSEGKGQRIANDIGPDEEGIQILIDNLVKGEKFKEIK